MTLLIYWGGGGRDNVCCPETRQETTKHVTSHWRSLTPENTSDGGKLYSDPIRVPGNFPWHSPRGHNHCPGHRPHLVITLSSSFEAFTIAAGALGRRRSQFLFLKNQDLQHSLPNPKKCRGMLRKRAHKPPDLARCKRARGFRTRSRGSARSKCDINERDARVRSESQCSQSQPSNSRAACLLPQTLKTNSCKSSSEMSRKGSTHLLRINSTSFNFHFYFHFHLNSAFSVTHTHTQNSL